MIVNTRKLILIIITGRCDVAKKSLPVEKLSASKKKPIPVKIVSDTANAIGPSHSKEQDKWRAEDDLRTLQRAKEIENDKAQKCKQQRILLKSRCKLFQRCANEVWYL